MMLIFLQDAHGFEHYLDKYGWPTLIALGMLFIANKAWKTMWPEVKAHMEGLRAKADEAHALVVEHVHLANMRAEREGKEVVTALQRLTERQNVIHAEQSAAIKEIHASETTALREITITVQKIAEKVEGNVPR